MKCKGTRDVFGFTDVHVDSCGDQPGGAGRRICRPVWNVRFEKIERLDRAVSPHHGRDQRNRLWLSLQQAAALAHRRHHLARRSRGGDPRALSVSPRGFVVLGLCRERRARAVFQCLRRCRAVVPENRVPATAGADAIRAAVPRGAIGADGNFRGVGIYRGEEISPRDGVSAPR